MRMTLLRRDEQFRQANLAVRRVLMHHFDGRLIKLPGTVGSPPYEPDHADDNRPFCIPRVSSVAEKTAEFVADRIKHENSIAKRPLA
ncbi:MAG: hypothetical protein ACYCSH_00590 [Acidithiobacillus sp.]